MEIVYFVLYLINFMAIKNTMLKYVNFVWTISLIRKIFSKILLQSIFKIILKLKEKMDNGVMIYKFKLSLKYMQDLLRYMFLDNNL